MRIKIIYNVPYDGMTSGWQTRYIGLMKELCKRNKIAIFAPGDTSRFRSEFPNAWVCGSSKNELRKPEYSLIRFLCSLLFPKRDTIFLPIFYFYSDFNELLAKDRSKYDMVFYCGLSSYIYYGHYDINTLKVCDFCDSFLRHFVSQFKTEKNIKKKIGIIFNIIYLIRVKRKFIDNKLLILSTTDRDSGYIKKILNKNVFDVVSNGVYLDEKIDKEVYLRSKWQSNSIIFCGSLDYAPNFFTMKYIMEKLWKPLKRKYPEIRINFVGRNPTDKLLNLVKDYPDVHVMSNVKSVEPYYKSAKMALIPMFHGGGIKNKVLEAIATATPIITNNEGIAGVNIISGVHGFVEEDEECVFRSVEKILRADFSNYKMWAENCIKLSFEYSWDLIGDKLNKILIKHLNRY